MAASVRLEVIRPLHRGQFRPDRRNSRHLNRHPAAAELGYVSQVADIPSIPASFLKFASRWAGEFRRGQLHPGQRPGAHRRCKRSAGCWREAGERGRDMETDVEQLEAFPPAAVTRNHRWLGRSLEIASVSTWPISGHRSSDEDGLVDDERGQSLRRGRDASLG
jgi:hypothetical protein